MQPRNLMLAVVGGGTLLGTLGGLAVDTQMKAPPDPPWRHTAQAPAESSYQLVDSGPQDLSPSWYADRTPTWKRDLAYRPATYVALREPAYEPNETFRADPGTDPAAVSDEAPTLAAGEHAAAAQKAAAADQAAGAPAGAPDAAEQRDEPAASDAVAS